MKKTIFVFSAAFLATFIIFFVYSGILIGKSVEEKCQRAKAERKTDCVNGLMWTVEDERLSFKDRNDAIWALGQIGDKQALELLEKYYTGFDGGHSNYHDDISQHELKKAIKLVDGGFNITQLVWKWFVDY
jgi:hypothetical protein